jgi:uncharacterized protein YodC (DUF2158 family)
MSHVSLISPVVTGRDRFVIVSAYVDLPATNRRMPMAFEPGDVVFLKSGGQPMTVAAVDEDNIECLWIGEEGELFRETIPAIVLTAAPDDDEEDEEESDEEDEKDDESEHEEPDEDEDEPTKSKRTA